MAITETIVRGKQQRRQDEIKVYYKWKVYCCKNKRYNVLIKKSSFKVISINIKPTKWPYIL